MTKQGEVRDWNKDMELCEKYSDEIWSALPDGSLFIRKGNQLTTYWDSGRENAVKEYRQALPHWLQQYGVELRGRKRWAEVAKGLNDDLNAAEAREKKLREAIEEAINEKSQWGDSENALDVVTRHLSKTLASLYPEEGEAK